LTLPRNWGEVQWPKQYERAKKKISRNFITLVLTIQEFRKVEASFF
jgi:hypothetical protein